MNKYEKNTTKSEIHSHSCISRQDFERIYPKLISLLRAQGAPHEDARDLAQRALIEAHRSYGRFQGRSTLDTWVVSIGKNLLLQYHRDVGRQKRKGEEVPHNDTLMAPDLEVQLISRDLLRIAGKAIQNLPDTQKQALLMAADGFKYREIATILHLSINRVGSLIYQARNRLRREMAA